MNEYKEGLARNLVEFFRSIGIEPLYGITIFMIIIGISYRKDIKNWEKLEGWRKGIIFSTFFAILVGILFSLLQLIGFIDL